MRAAVEGRGVGREESNLSRPASFDCAAEKFAAPLRMLRFGYSAEELTMEQKRPSVELILKALALAMGVASVVLSILGAATVQTLGTLLGLGVFALALAALQNQ